MRGRRRWQRHAAAGPKGSNAGPAGEFAQKDPEVSLATGEIIIEGYAISRYQTE